MRNQGVRSQEADLEAAVPLTPHRHDNIRNIVCGIKSTLLEPGPHIQPYTLPQLHLLSLAMVLYHLWCLRLKIWAVGFQQWAERTIPSLILRSCRFWGHYPWFMQSFLCWCTCCGLGTDPLSSRFSPWSSTPRQRLTMVSGGHRHWPTFPSILNPTLLHGYHLVLHFTYLNLLDFVVDL
jgi:hypothetical protein